MSVAKPLSLSAQRVQEALAAAGVDAPITEYDVPARTSAEAAKVLGCEVAQIAKSLVFRAASGRPVLVIASGASRVDERKIEALLGEPIGKADPAYVRETTGFVIGGIPPLAHRSPMAVFIDRDCCSTIACLPQGEPPHAMFPIAPADLVRASRGTLADVALQSS